MTIRTVDMWVQRGLSANDCFICQKCKAILPVQLGEQACECGQKWLVKICKGDAFAGMDRERGRATSVSGNPCYWNGYLIKAV